MLRTSYIVKNHLMHGKRMIAFRSPDSVDVDNVRDFIELERIVEKYQGDVLNYLRKE